MKDIYKNIPLKIDGDLFKFNKLINNNIKLLLNKNKKTDYYSFNNKNDNYEILNKSFSSEINIKRFKIFKDTFKFNNKVGLFEIDYILCNICNNPVYLNVIKYYPFTANGLCLYCNNNIEYESYPNNMNVARFKKYDFNRLKQDIKEEIYSDFNESLNNRKCSDCKFLFINQCERRKYIKINDLELSCNLFEKK